LLTPKDKLRLEHMRSEAQKVRQKVAGRCRKELDEDEDLAAVLAWRLALIGEAAARVSASLQNRYPTVPWLQIAGMRNRLIHGYDTIDLDLVWQTIEDDLPPLIAALDAILSE
jgi:uncharacterized protein with HEPN domain